LPFFHDWHSSKPEHTRRRDVVKDKRDRFPGVERLEGDRPGRLIIATRRTSLSPRAQKGTSALRSLRNLSRSVASRTTRLLAHPLLLPRACHQAANPARRALTTPCAARSSRSAGRPRHTGSERLPANAGGIARSRLVPVLCCLSPRPNARGGGFSARCSPGLV